MVHSEPAQRLVNWTGGNTTQGYVPVDLNASDYRLTSREGLFAGRRLIPREDWQFGQVVNGQHVSDPNFLTLKGGFKPGLTYKLAYESQNPPVAGVGLAAVRDMASAMKYNPGIVAPGRYAYMYGSSQTGRTLRPNHPPGLHHRRARPQGVRRSVYQDRRSQQRQVQRAFCAGEFAGRFYRDAVSPFSIRSRRIR